MPSVTLDQVYIHLASDESDFVSAITDAAAAPVAVPEEVRSYANGVNRSVRRPGQRKTLNLRLDLMDRESYLWLEDHAGDLVMVRDEVGRKLWGTYNLLDENDHAGGVDDNGEAPANVAITVTQVTYSEIV